VDNSPSSGPSGRTLIGVVHRDPDGEDRLRRLLDELRPELITVEVSPYAVEYRRQHGARLLRLLDELTPPGKEHHGEIEGIRETLLIPFEARATWGYAAEHPAKVELVDDSELSRDLLDDVERELLTPENVKLLAERPDFSLRRTVDSFYRRAHRLMKDEPVSPARLGFSAERLALLELRDEQMESRVRALLAAREGARWAHIGGVFHLMKVRGLRLLWERFADDGAARMFLDEVD
jgi:hypothetical protein